VKLFKSILAVLVAWAVVFGLCYDAKADSPVTFSGYLRLRAFGFGGFFPPSSTAENTDSRSERFAVSRLRLNVVFKPNENVEIRWRFHAPHGSRWGGGNYTDIRTVYAFGRAKTRIGNFSIGRISSDVDSSGLQTLGYAPTWGFSSQGFIFDSDSEWDGAMYRNDWANGFGIKAIYLKRVSTVPTAAAPYKDADYDRFSFEPYYKWAGGGFSFAIQYDNIKNTPTAVDQNHFFSINPAFMHKFALGENSSMTLHLEGKYSSGKRQEINQEAVDTEGAGLYGDLNFNYGSGETTLAGWWFNGNDSGNVQGTVKNKGLVNSGQAFYPFLIFNQNLVTNLYQSLEGVESSGHWGIALLGNHKFSKDITMNYGLGKFGKVGDFILASGEAASKDMGTELDVGITAQLMQNISYSTKLGFFFPGDYYNEKFGREDYDDTVWGWAHELIFSF
jgi:hypothetical protein